MKKIKKIILAVIVSLIALISVFSCFKGKYTPEPILTPVSVLKASNSTNDNVISSTGTYEQIYFNTSYDFSDIDYYKNLSFPVVLSRETTGNDFDLKYLPIYLNAIDGTMLSLVMFYLDENHNNISLGIDNIQTMQEIKTFFTTTNDIYYWYEFENPYQFELNNGVSSFEYMGQTYEIGNQNHLLTNLISPEPFLFEGTSSSIAWTSSGLDNPNNVQNIYFNTNLTNQAIKNILDTYIGDTSGIDIFSYLDTGVRVRCHVINNSANAFIQIIGGSTIIYKWIYDPIDTDETIWWYGIDPNIIDNGNVLISPKGISLEGFNKYELRVLFSSSNDFTETPSGDSYEQGYQDGYTAGQTAGYNQGYTAGETAGYNQGYLDGLDDGAGSNVNFQYIESVLNLIGNFLNIEILPNIKLSYALGIIIILSIISIIKMVVK